MNLKDSILKKDIPSFMLFVGKEYALKRIYLNKMSELFGLPVVFVNSLAAVVPRLSGGGLFGSSAIYVVSEDTDYKATSEKNWNTFLNLKTDNFVVLLYDTIDKRSAFYKTHKDVTVSFDLLDEVVLVPRIQAICGLNETMSKKLVKMCGYNYNKILLEFDKIRALAEYEDVKFSTAFCMLLEAGCISEEVGDIVFDFVDSVLYRDTKNAYALLEKLRSVGESDIKLLSLLYTAFRHQLIVKFTKSDDWEATLGLKFWQCSNIRNKSGHYTPVELLNNVKFLRKVETEVKSGLLETNLLMEYILINIL